MSEIPERVTRYRIDNGGFLQEHSRGNLVEITSAVPAIREQVLADAKARIEGNLDEYPGTDSPYRSGYMAARRAALAALTQPQSEGCPDCESEDGMKDHPDGAAPCPTCRPETDGGGAATPRGVADADLEGEGVYEAVYACLDACGGTMGSTALHFLADLDERGFRVVRATHESFTEEPGPYAKAFRERVCPVPEFPSVGTAPQEAQADPKKDVCPNCGEVANGCNYCRKTPAPVPQTEKCPRCSGYGTLTAGDDCELCAGSGSVPQTEGECPEPFCRNGIMGAGITRRTCPTCSGTGKEGEK